MIIFLSFLLLSCASGPIHGELVEDESRTVYIPKKASPTDDHIGVEEGTYCYQFTWLGEEFDNNTFPNVQNKTCTEQFTKDNPRLCVDPMVVTFRGGKPDIDYIRKNHFEVATCKLSKDRVCAKYTVYYNGVASHVVRYCTRIDVQSEGPLQSGCLSAKNGSYEYEVCACKSGRGGIGICNSTTRNQSCIFQILTFLILSVVVFDGLCIT